MNHTNRQPVLRVHLGLLAAMVAAWWLPGAARAASGSWKFDVLYSFSAGAAVGWDSSGLVEGSPGVFWGASNNGGASGLGTVYRLQVGGHPELVHSFAGGDGKMPAAELLKVGDWLYGTTSSGGNTDNGVIYRISAAGAYQVAHHFDFATDGAAPDAALIQAQDGRLYGTTSAEGPLGAGTIYRFDPAAGAFTVLHSFAQFVDEPGPGGGTPIEPLVQHGNGHFYGTTFDGGSFGLGTVFKLTLSGSFKTLHHFGGDDVGGWSTGALAENKNGVLVGPAGPVFDSAPGSLYTIAPPLRDAVKPLHTFRPRKEGGRSHGQLVLRSDGRLYGVTSSGARSCGAVYAIDAFGVVSVTHAFAADGHEGCTGYKPLARGLDGALYGVTSAGGANGLGTIFRLRWVPAL